jgi:hypothetical protein
MPIGLHYPFVEKDIRKFPNTLANPTRGKADDGLEQQIPRPRRMEDSGYHNTDVINPFLTVKSQNRGWVQSSEQSLC